MIEVPVPVVQPLPSTLTAPLAPPAAPPSRCTLAGRPAVCVIDALQWAASLRGVLDRANADRAAAARISQGGAHGAQR